MDLVERIKALCSERGITLNQMEKELGLKGTVARWQEHEPSVGKVRLVAQFFGMTVSELIEDQWNELDMSDAWAEDNKKSLSPTDRDRAERQEFIRLYEAAPAWVRENVRNLLRDAESAREVPGADPKG